MALSSSRTSSSRALQAEDPLDKPLVLPDPTQTQRDLITAESVLPERFLPQAAPLLFVLLPSFSSSFLCVFWWWWWWWPSESDALRKQKCISCPDGEFTEEPGQPECVACGALTYSNADNTDCLTDCVYTNNGKTYDLNPLSFVSFSFLSLPLFLHPERSISRV